MELVVVKLGAVMLDFAHACGLALLLAHITQSEVKLIDVGSCYMLKATGAIRRLELVESVNELLQIPNADEFKRYQESSHHPLLAVLNMDGILAVLFTSPGVRTVSVQDVLVKKQFSPAAPEQSLAKIARAVKRWMKKAAEIVQAQPNWMDNLLKSYSSNQLSAAIPIIASKATITIPMTIDPIFSYSTRRLLSDGLISHRTNISLGCTVWAPLLIIIGAIRLLRAQRAAGGMVMFYMPIAETMTLSPETALPLLHASAHSNKQALMQHWLDPVWRTTTPESRWGGLSYQVMQTQGAQQSISQRRGYLNYGLLRTIERNAGSMIIECWRSLLRHDQRDVKLELSPLIDALLHRRLSSWLEHLDNSARHAYRGSGQWLDLYALAEVKEVTRIMSGSIASPLRAVLERNQGTLRVGRALRLLGRYNLASLRDLIDMLDAVSNQDALLHVVWRAAQECELASARTEFMLVPDENDLALLLDDVAQFGARTLAQLLIAISAMRYPRERVGAESEVGT